MYCRKSLNHPERDRLRDAIIAQFEKQLQVKKTDVLRHLQEAGDESADIDDTTYNKLMKEFSVSGKGGVWTLKSGSYTA